MKFKVEKKDFIIFVCYSILLLYLCCVAVLNFTSLANDGSFYGLLPFKAFIMPYLPVTIGLFFAGEIVVFTSVSSYIFSKDKKGDKVINFKSKDSDGYAQWADKKEIINGKDIELCNPKDDVLQAAGIPLINNGKEIYVDNGETHNLIIGSTGSGKTETIVKPMVKLLARHEESMIITDPKGEIYKQSAALLKEKGYNVVLLNFREPEHGNCWNPLEMPYNYFHNGNKDKALELLDDVAMNILKDPNTKADPFWEDSAADYFSGLTLGLFMDAKPKEVNISSVNYMSALGEERVGPKTILQDYFTSKGEDSNAYILASNTINAPTDTKGSILSTFRQKIRIFSSRDSISEMLSTSDFDMKSIGRQKTAVFMTIHDEKKTYHGLLTIFLKQCYETLIDVAQENGGKLNYRTNFILDEFANMPPLKDVDSMVSAARSRRIRFTFIIQNFSQLNSVYTKEVADTIKGNCGNLIYLMSTELSALEEISKLCGEVKAKEKDKSATRPLVSVTDLQKMKLFETLLIRQRGNPFKTKLEPDFKMKWGKEYPLSEYPDRKKNEVELFDVKKFVTEYKQKQMEENGGNMPGAPMSPFGPNPFGASPFGPSPFGGNPFNQNPFTSKPQSNPFTQQKPMDIDQMMKDIDKKLKELDEEEAREKEKAKTSSKNLGNKTLDELLDEMDNNVKESSLPFDFDDDDKKEEIKNEETKEETPIVKEEEKVKPIVEETPIDLEKESPLGIYDQVKIDSENQNRPKFTSKPVVDVKEEIPKESILPPKQEEVKTDDLSKEEEFESLFDDDFEKEPEKPKINVDTDSIIVNDNIITDDEFFDDFFGE